LVPITKDLKRSPKLLWLDCGFVNYWARGPKEGVWGRRGSFPPAPLLYVVLLTEPYEARFFVERLRKG
ncbi:MAG: hypothetical protein FWG00_02085, partial [Coriobacteriia bacterium]|nr:hypothetical protein [Coriobacteriia bacterium]